MIKPIAEYRLGRWQDVTKDIESVDSIITDAPYSEKTHLGSRSTLEPDKSFINYDFITEDLVEEVVKNWAYRFNNWFIVFGDDQSSKWWKKHLELAGLYVFAPVYYIKLNPTPRIQADGPTSSGEIITRAVPMKNLTQMAISVLDEYDPRLFQLLDAEEGIITAARLKKSAIRDKKSRPGHYLAKSQTQDSRVTGQKDLEACCRIIDDYSAPGDFVLDIFGGYATLLKAAQVMGRNSIGCEAREPIWIQGKMRLQTELAQTTII